jgi:hypothetical protein
VTSKVTRRVFILSALLLLSVMIWAPDLRRVMGHPLGTTGVSFNYEGVVTHVDPGAASSGIRIGDKIDLTRAGLDARTPISASASPMLGRRSACR